MRRVSAGSRCTDKYRTMYYYHIGAPELMGNTSHNRDTEIHKKHWVDLSTPTELLVEVYTLDKRGVINQPLVYEANSNTGVTPSPV